MRNIDFEQMGGIPLKQPTLDFMQSGYQDHEKAFLDWIRKESFLGAPGETAIVLVGLEQKTELGIEVITPGWVVRNGSLLYFAGAPLESVVSGNGIGIQTLTTSAVYKDGSTKQVYEHKLAVAGGDSPLPLGNYQRVVNIADVRPVLARTFRYHVPAIAAGTLNVINFNVPQAEVGDVAVVSVAEVVEGGGSTTYGISHWVSAKARVMTVGQVQVILINQHQSQAAFDGWAEFKLRILK